MTHRGMEFSEMILMGKAHSRYTYYIWMHRNNWVFSVRSSTNLDWKYSFFMPSMEKYEQVKQCIVDAIPACKDMDAMMNHLEEKFESDFKDILINWNTTSELEA